MCHFGYRVTPWWVKLIKFLAKQYSDFKKIMVVCEFTSAIYTIENCHILTFKVNFQCKESPEEVHTQFNDSVIAQFKRLNDYPI